MWSRRPFVRIFILISSGIVVGNYLPFENSILYSGLLLLIIIIYLIFSENAIIKKTSYNQQLNRGLLILIMTFLTGVFLLSTRKVTQNVCFSEKGNYLANIKSITLRQGKGVKAIASITHLDSVLTGSEITAVIYFEDSLPDLSYGDVILFNSSIKQVNGPMNPYEFDYRNYLLNKGINHSTYVKSNNWIKVGQHPANKILFYSNRVRELVLRRLEHIGLEPQGLAVASAILLGYDDLMEKDIKNEFMISGSMHILCVSGLHVGIIYLVFSTLLSFLGNAIFSRILKSILLISLIWSYAIITGLAPSVQRAALMISVFIIGNCLSKKADPYNNLAISGTILLILDPYLLYSPGFQLSYGAVLSIVSFYFSIYSFIKINNPIIDKIWSVTVLSVSAQLGTFPIAIYYFGQFPTWFWISNLFTFPLSFMIIVSGLLYISLSWFPLLSSIAGIILSYLISALNWIIISIADFPGASVNNIYFSLYMVVCIYCAIYSFYLLITYKRISYAKYLLISLLIIICINTYYNYSTLTQKKLIAYSIGNHSVIEFIIGKDQLIFADSLILADPSKIEYNIEKSRLVWSADNKMVQLGSSDSLFFNGFCVIDNFFLFNDKIFYLTNANSKVQPNNQKVNINGIFIVSNKIRNIEKLTRSLEIKNAIVTNSVTTWRKDSYTDILEKKSVSVHYTKKDGAWILND